MVDVVVLMAHLEQIYICNICLGKFKLFLVVLNLLGEGQDEGEKESGADGWLSQV